LGKKWNEGYIMVEAHLYIMGPVAWSITKSRRSLKTFGHVWSRMIKLQQEWFIWIGFGKTTLSSKKQLMELKVVLPKPIPIWNLFKANSQVKGNGNVFLFIYVFSKK
jgi:hypothetical protein